MDISNPLFIVPSGQVNTYKKPGGGGYRYFGDINRFETHKRQRTTEIESVIQSSLKSTKVKAPNNNLYFEIELNKAATAKSSQPKKLFKSYHIDIEAQVSETKFYATATESHLNQFRDSVSKFDIDKNKYESAYLSAIDKISNIPKSKKLPEDLSEKQEGFLYLHSNLSEREGRQVLEQIKEVSESQDLEFYVSPSGAKIIYGSYNRDDLGEIVSDSPHNPVLRFEKSQFFMTPQSIDSQYVMEDTEIVMPTLDAKIGILDTGVEALPVLKGLILDSKDYVKGRSHEKSWHGTLTASRAIFGNNIEDELESDNTLYAKARIYDFRVLTGEEDKPTSDRDIIKHITDIFENHSQDVKVYNLSFSGEGGVHTHSMKSYITRELDALAKRYDVVVIVAAGNHEIFKKNKLDADYLECLTMEASTISAPADGVNVVSVGSLADAGSTRSLAKSEEPSPFSRHGEEGTWKPDLTHYGGNLTKLGHASGIGVKGLSYEQNRVKESAGTSFAAPLVSQVAAQIYTYVKDTGEWNSNPVDLTRALLLHSGLYTLPADSEIDSSNLRQLTGFGVPDLGRALDSSSNAASFVYVGEIGDTEMNEDDEEFNGAIQKIQFTIPDELNAKGKKVRVKGTLVYMPSVNPAGGSDYVECDIDVNLHYYNSKGTFKGAGLTQGDYDFRDKWNPVKSFQKTFSAYNDGLWEIWLTATKRGSIDGSNDGQKYALVVTVEDVTEDPDNRIDLQEVIRLKHKQYVAVKTQVKQVVTVK